MTDRPQATATQTIDESRVRVTHYRFEPGAETGWHIHPLDYVITAITDCHMRLEMPDGTIKTNVVKAGESYRRDAGVEHNVINDGTDVMAFVEIELKDA